MHPEILMQIEICKVSGFNVFIRDRNELAAMHSILPLFASVDLKHELVLKARSYKALRY